MASAAQLRQQIEAKLAERSSVRLALSPRLVCPGSETGYSTLDAVLRGGLPVAGTSEIVGSRSSGRATLAAAYIAERSREGHVCAWVDVAGDLSPEAALADGVDLERVLWVRCLGKTEEAVTPRIVPANHVEGMYLVGHKSSRRDRTIGTPGAPNRPLAGKERVEQVNSDRQPARRGALVLKQHVAAKAMNALPSSSAGESLAVKQTAFTKPRKPWNRLEQAIKSVDLLVQAGGFGAIVLDMGGVAPQFARRIPLATWFRWRAALERTRSSLVVLSQMGCTGAGAELVLRVEAEVPEPGTVRLGVEYRLEVGRRRFAEASVENRRKQPARASAWASEATGMVG